jgi:hypothetical protein
MSALHGTAMKRATEKGSMGERRSPAPAPGQRRNDLLAETAAWPQGFWAANPAGQTGTELMAAALLIWAPGSRSTTTSSRDGWPWVWSATANRSCSVMWSASFRTISRWVPSRCRY